MDPMVRRIGTSRVSRLNGHGERGEQEKEWSVIKVQR